VQKKTRKKVTWTGISDKMATRGSLFSRGSHDQKMGEGNVKGRRKNRGPGSFTGTLQTRGLSVEYSAAFRTLLNEECQKKAGHLHTATRGGPNSYCVQSILFQRPRGGRTFYNRHKRAPPPTYFRRSTLANAGRTSIVRKTGQPHKRKRMLGDV